MPVNIVAFTDKFGSHDNRRHVNTNARRSVVERKKIIFAEIQGQLRWVHAKTKAVVVARASAEGGTKAEVKVDIEDIADARVEAMTKLL